MNVLITGAGAPGAAGIISCLQKGKKIQLWCCDADPNASGKHIAKNFFVIPKATDKKFTSELLRLSRLHKIEVILPLVTNELLPLARNKDKFQKHGIKVITSTTYALEIANNKSRLYDFLLNRGILVPEYVVVNTYDQFIRGAKQLGYPKRVITFKPSLSNGSRGFRIIDDTIDKAALLWKEKPNNLYISYKEIKEILRNNPFKELLLSEYLPGEEYSIDCLTHHGKCLLALPRKRTKIMNGISVAGEFVENTEMISYCQEIVEAIGLHGNIGIQVKKSATGEFKILEINPRVQGTIVSALGAGVNLPLMAIKLELGEKVTLPKIKWGTKFTRVWKEIYYK